MKTKHFFKKFFLVLLGAFIMDSDEINAQESKYLGESSSSKQAEAIFAGGCFWCMQAPFEKQAGVIETVVGYTGGAETPAPTYESVSEGQTGHFEALKVIYDPHTVSYDDLLKIFWENIDPLDGAGQFCDKGDQYRSAIFYGNEREKKAAEASLKKISEVLLASVKTLILPQRPFFDAEEYHQNYHTKNPLRYKFYRFNCGRDKRLEALWGEHKR